MLQIDFNPPNASSSSSSQNIVNNATGLANKGLANAATKTDWGKIFSNAGDVLAGLGQLGSLGLGIWQGIVNQKNWDKQMDLAKEQFAFSKDATNRDLANKATMINEQVAARAGLADAFGKRDGSVASAYKQKYSVDGSPIG